MIKAFSVLMIFIGFHCGYMHGQCVSGSCENGNGTYKLPNGDMYTGNWVAGVRDGYGRYDWAGGSYYVGEFKDNMLHGKGTFYGVDGKVMAGIFIENNYAGPESDSTRTEGFDPNHAYAEEWKKMKEEDSIARANTLARARQVPFCEMVQLLVKDFGNQFVSYLGERQRITLDRNMNWYGTLMTAGSIEAGIIGEKGKPQRTYYNLLFESTDSATAMQQYAAYVEQLKTCDNGCCAMVYSNFQHTQGAQKSATTTWATISVNAPNDPLIYTNMIMELECLTRVGRPGWVVVFRLYDAAVLKTK